MELQTITIKFDTVYDEIKSRLYYEGESLKRKDIDFVSIQAGEDDSAQLSSFIDTALNNISQQMLKRLVSYTYTKSDDSAVMTFYPNSRIPETDAVKAVVFLTKAIIDYVVNYAMYEWLLVVKPEIANINEQRISPLMFNLCKYIEMLSKMPRRRATDLAGI